MGFQLGGFQLKQNGVLSRLYACKSSLGEYRYQACIDRAVAPQFDEVTPLAGGSSLLLLRFLLLLLLLMLMLLFALPFEDNQPVPYTLYLLKDVLRHDTC
jgi:hypothetical protein